MVMEFVPSETLERAFPPAKRPSTTIEATFLKALSWFFQRRWWESFSCFASYSLAAAVGFHDSSGQWEKF
jgi:hypothetical protein